MLNRIGSPKVKTLGEMMRKMKIRRNVSDRLKQHEKAGQGNLPDIERQQRMKKNYGDTVI